MILEMHGKMADNFRRYNLSASFPYISKHGNIRFPKVKHIHYNYVVDSVPWSSHRLSCKLYTSKHFNKPNTLSQNCAMK